MYIPKSFEQDDKSQLIEFVSNNPFSTLVCGTGELEACHIPLYILETVKDNYILKGHISRANSLWKTVEDNSQVIAIFLGPHRYISPNLYPTKKEHGKAVPTWNYVSVHIKGKILFKNESEWKIDMLNQLTNILEAENENPWSLSDAPSEYIEKQLKGIVGIEIAVSSISGQWKLSQNQPKQNKSSVMDFLSSSKNTDDNTMLELMKKL